MFVGAKEMNKWGKKELYIEVYFFIWDFEKQSPEVFCKKTVLKNFAKFTEKHQVRVSFLMKLQASACNIIQKETLAQVFSCELCDLDNIFSQNTSGGCF